MQQNAEHEDAVHLLLDDASLFGAEHGRVRGLSGFQRELGHRPPEAHSPTSEEFIAEVGDAEVAARAQRLHAGLRERLGYRRKEIGLQLTPGAAELRTPDFTVRLHIAQDAEDARRYALWTEVGLFADLGTLERPGFLSLFSPFCDTLLVAFDAPFDVEGKIDEIEESPELRKLLHYDLDATEFTLDFAAQGLQIRVTAREASFRLSAGQGLERLIAGTVQALGAFQRAGMPLLAPARETQS